MKALDSGVLGKVSWALYPWDAVSTQQNLALTVYPEKNVAILGNRILVASFSPLVRPRAFTGDLNTFAVRVVSRMDETEYDDEMMIRLAVGIMALVRQMKTVDQNWSNETARIVPSSMRMNEFSIPLLRRTIFRAELSPAQVALCWLVCASNAALPLGMVADLVSSRADSALTVPSNLKSGTELINALISPVPQCR